MKLTARPAPSMTPIQTVSAGSLPAPHGAACRRSIRRGERLHMRGREADPARRRVMYARVGDVPVAHAERLLRRLDAQVHVVGAVGIGSRRYPARRGWPGSAATRRPASAAEGCRRVPQRVRERQRRTPAGAVVAQVVQRERAAACGEISRNRSREIARDRNRRAPPWRVAGASPPSAADRTASRCAARCRPAGTSRRSPAGRRKPSSFAAVVRVLAARHRDAVPRIVDRIGEQARERKAPAKRLACCARAQAPIPTPCRRRYSPRCRRETVSLSSP